MAREVQIVSVVCCVQSGSTYPGSYRVLFTESDSDIQSVYVNGVDELDAYRRAKRWFDAPYPEPRYT